MERFAFRPAPEQTPDSNPDADIFGQQEHPMSDMERAEFLSREMDRTREQVVQAQRRLERLAELHDKYVKKGQMKELDLSETEKAWFRKGEDPLYLELESAWEGGGDLDLVDAGEYGPETRYWFTKQKTHETEALLHRIEGLVNQDGGEKYVDLRDKLIEDRRKLEFMLRRYDQELREKEQS